MPSKEASWQEEKVFGSGSRPSGFQMYNLNLTGPPFPSINWNPRGWSEDKRTNTSKGLSMWEEMIAAVLQSPHPVLIVWCHRLTLLGSPSPGATRALGQFKHFHFPHPTPTSFQEGRFQKGSLGSQS